MAVTSASAASSASKIMSVSGTLPRFSAVVAGDRARTPAAISPAAGPASRRTTRYSTSTASVPSMICGSTTAQLCAPKTPTLIACSQNAPGSLSVVMVPAGSKAPKKKLDRLIDMLRAAAA